MSPNFLNSYSIRIYLKTSICNRAILFGIILAAALLFQVDAPASSRDRSLLSGSSTQVLVVGHRGAAGLAPENTLAGFSRVCGIGVDAIELDVMLTKDNHLVVHHDYALKPEIARTTNDRWIPEQSPPVVKDTPLAELKTFDVGRLKPGTRYARRYPDQQPVDGEQIPSLGEVIDLVKNKCSPDTRLWIEIKTSPEESMSSDPIKTSDAVVRIVNASGFSDRVRILSFDWRALVHVQKIASRIPTVYLSLAGLRLNNIKPGQPGQSPWLAGFDVDDFGGSVPRTVQAAGGRYWAPHYRQVTRQEIQLAHKLGIRVFVWTPDKRNDMLRLMEMGVDAIITNRPDILLSILDER